MAKRDNEGGNRLMDFVWGAIILLALLVFLLDW